jgi:hypothetical protein
MKNRFPLLIIFLLLGLMCSIFSVAVYFIEWMPPGMADFRHLTSAEEVRDYILLSLPLGTSTSIEVDSFISRQQIDRCFKQSRQAPDLVYDCTFLAPDEELTGVSWWMNFLHKIFTVYTYNIEFVLRDNILLDVRVGQLQQSV